MPKTENHISEAQVEKFWPFTVKIYWPYFFILVPHILMLGLGGLVNIFIAEDKESQLVGLYGLVISLLPFFVMWLTYRLYWSANKKHSKIFILYLNQVLIVSVATGAQLLVLGGTSMAVVDGGSERGVASNFFIIVEILLLSQLFMMPWTLFVARKLEKLTAQ